MPGLKRDFLPNDLQKEISSIGFSGSIAVQARQNIEETEWLLKLADQNEHIKGVVGWVDLCSSEIETQLQEFSKHPKFVGVRHVLQDEADERFMLRESFLNGISLLSKYNLVYEVLVFPRHLPVAVELVKNFPEQKFVLDHIAKPEIINGNLSPWQENVSELAKYPNVYCKLSGMVTEADWSNWENNDFLPYLEVVNEAFGSNRMMIGSDWPVCTLAGKYSDVMGIVIDYLQKLKPEEQAAVIGRNAIGIYNLSI